jgi:choline kinase
MGGEVPKALQPLKDKPPLFHYILEGLKREGITDLLVVTGFASESVQSFVTEEWTEGEVTFVRNARFASWGNFHSVRVAIDQSPGYDLLVVNSDIVMRPEIFVRVARGPGDLVLAVEQRLRFSDEDMRVRLAGDRVLAIGKDVKMALSHGEFCGVSLLRPPAAQRYTDISGRLEWTARTSVYYEDVYAAMLESVDVRAVPVTPGDYAEVDVPADVDGAIAVIERHYSSQETE